MELTGKPARGFTLIELMVAVLIFAILAAIGVPSWRETIQNNRVTGATNNIVTALNVARSEAVRRGIPVALCGVADANGDATAKTCLAAGTAWTTGWMVFTDNTGTVGERDGTDVVLQVWPAVGGNVVAKLSTASVNVARYDVAGMMTGVTPKTFRVGMTGCTGNKVGETSVTAVGNVRTYKAACPA